MTEEEKQAKIDGAVERLKANQDPEKAAEAEKLAAERAEQERMIASNTSGTDAARSRINPDFVIEDNPHSHIKHVIGVVSGKGGVGKSFVTASLANLMRSKGHPTGIMDADITGPSIPKMYGLHGQIIGDEYGSFPMTTDNDVEVMSMNVLLDTEETPVIWRGPVIAGVVKQFWTDVQWGDLDYLFVDMPPGTGDVPLTAFQSLPLDGIVIVTSPQELVSLIVKKAYNMAQMMNIPVLGVVENYSYMSCPHCGEKINVFGESSIDDVAAELGIPVLGKLPMDPTYAQNADNGVCYLSEIPALSPAEEVLTSL